jgi:hypothetical protein
MSEIFDCDTYRLKRYFIKNLQLSIWGLCAGSVITITACCKLVEVANNS